MDLRLPVGIVALVAATSCVPRAAERPVAMRTDPSIGEAKAFVDRLAFGAPSTLPAADAAAMPGVGPVGAASSAVAAPPFVAATRSIDDTRRAIDCLTAAVYYEARSEPRDGQRAVAQVVLNRVRDRAFPASVCGVVYQGSQRRTGCQFSFTCDGSMAARRDEGAWERSREVAAAALAGDVYPDVGSATFYHTTAILPWWAPSLSRIGTVGAHIFYRWRNALERSLAFRQSYGGAEPLAGPRAPLVAAANASDTGASLDDDGWRVSQVAGVTIHRTSLLPAATPPSAATSAAPAAVVAPAMATAPIPSASRPARALVAGVRVHRNIDFQAAPDAI